MTTETEKKKRKPKKEGRIAQAYRLHQEGMSAKDIAAKMELSESVIKSYIWRMQNPQKYQQLLRRYFTKRRQKAENAAIKEALKNSKKRKRKKKEEVASTT